MFSFLIFSPSFSPALCFLLTPPPKRGFGILENERKKECPFFFSFFFDLSPFLFNVIALSPLQ